jgi:E3 ubiquitin-protein ligase TRIP12
VVASFASSPKLSAMYRSIPVVNKACVERVRKREHDMHRQRIKSMRPQVDTTVPTVCHLDHLRNNLKREQLLEERYYEIDRENRILLQKMSDIMRNASYSADRAKSGPPSLNRDSRKMELMRITQENQAILKRIQQAQPVYNHVAWEDSYRRSGSYLRNSAEYPIVLQKRLSSSRISLTPLGKDSNGFDKLDQQSGVHKPEEDADELRYVLKEGKKIGQTYYLVEMATDGRTLAISAYDGDSRRTLELLVNEKNHRRLYRDANGDYNLIAEKLRVEGEQLVLPTIEQAVAALNASEAGGAAGHAS